MAPIYTEIERQARSLVGQSAYDIESIWQGFYSRRASSHGASVMSSLAAIDCALWDIVGQKLNVPVYKLLGGKRRARVHGKFNVGSAVTIAKVLEPFRPLFFPCVGHRPRTKSCFHGLTPKRIFA